MELRHQDNYGQLDTVINLTSSDGRFEFAIDLSGESAGYHSFTVIFEGMLENYYLPVEGSYFIDTSVDPLISFSCDNDIIAGENATLVFNGNPGAVFTLEYFWNNNWTMLEQIVLDENGFYGYDWTVSDELRGPVMLSIRFNQTGSITIFNIEV
ncbi:MAG: hypothetical protein ACTSP4_14835, partial [Candidatus Hodarchaeales archaeon]